MQYSVTIEGIADIAAAPRQMTNLEKTGEQCRQHENGERRHGAKDRTWLINCLIRVKTAGADLGSTRALGQFSWRPVAESLEIDQDGSDQLLPPRFLRGHRIRNLRLKRYLALSGPNKSGPCGEAHIFYIAQRAIVFCRRVAS